MHKHILTYYNKDVLYTPYCRAIKVRIREGT